jgi:hypothetical protein
LRKVRASGDTKELLLLHDEVNDPDDESGQLQWQPLEPVAGSAADAYEQNSSACVTSAAPRLEVESRLLEHTGHAGHLQPYGEWKMNSRRDVHDPFNLHCGDDLATARRGTTSDSLDGGITPQDNHRIIGSAFPREALSTGRRPHADHELMGELAIEYACSYPFTLQARFQSPYV